MGFLLKDNYFMNPALNQVASKFQHHCRVLRAVFGVAIQNPPVLKDC